MIHTQELGFVIQIRAQHYFEAMGYKFLHNIWPLIIVQDTIIFCKIFIFSFITVDLLEFIHQQRVEDAKSREEENAAKV
jgi:hypothetical protein